MASTKSFRIDDLLRNPKDLKVSASNGAAILQVPVSAAPIDYSRPRLVNSNQDNIICANNPLSILRSTTTNEKGAFQEISRQPCHGHILSNTVANNSINLQFLSATNIGPNQPQALLMETQKLNQNRQPIAPWAMNPHHHVSGNSMIMSMPIHPGGSFPFPVGVMKFPSGPGHFIEQAKFPEAICDRVHYSMYPFIRHGHGYSHCRRKGGQIRFNNSQTGQLEKAFLSQKYLTSTERRKLAQSLGLSDRQVKTWFQNRRAKFRKSNKSSRTCIDRNNNEDPIKPDE